MILVTAHHPLAMQVPPGTPSSKLFFLGVNIWSIPANIWIWEIGTTQAGGPGGRLGPRRGPGAEPLAGVQGGSAPLKLRELNNYKGHLGG